MRNTLLIKKILRKNKLSFDAKKVKNIEVAFLDTDGNIREIFISKSKLFDALKNGLKCDGSSIGISYVTESDVKITLDSNSVYILPNNNLLIISNTNYSFDSRRQLIELEKEKQQGKLKINVGIELEFYLFKKDEKLDDLKYYETKNNSEFLCLNEIMNFCENINFPIENFHHECGQSQFEINFKYNIPHKTADNLVFLSKIINYFAEKFELIADFSPKPFESECGSGMHTNISISKNKTNLFFDKNDKLGLSQIAYNFANGIMNHIEAITAISNSTNKSFERLNFGTETPKTVNICSQDRTALIRVPYANKQSKRIEFRLPDTASNPYLLFNLIIVAGFDDSTEHKKKNILPKNLNEAKKYLKKDELFKKFISSNYFK